VLAQPSLRFERDPQPQQVAPARRIRIILAWARDHGLPVRRFALGSYGEAIHELAA
jgi:hypothetical protein